MMLAGGDCVADGPSAEDSAGSGEGFDGALVVTVEGGGGAVVCLDEFAEGDEGAAAALALLELVNGFAEFATGFQSLAVGADLLDLGEGGGNLKGGHSGKVSPPAGNGMGRVPTPSFRRRGQRLGSKVRQGGAEALAPRTP